MLPTRRFSPRTPFRDRALTWGLVLALAPGASAQAPAPLDPPPPPDLVLPGLPLPPLPTPPLPTPTLPGPLLPVPLPTPPSPSEPAPAPVPPVLDIPAPTPPAPTPSAPTPPAPPPAPEVPMLPPTSEPATLPGLSGAPLQPVEEGASALRGLWVDAFGPGLKTRLEVQQTVDDAVKMGVNTLFVQAIRRGDCLCMKSGLPLVSDPGLEKNFDPLAIITRQAHARGLRVIAWASVTGIANAAVPSRAPGHVLKKHGPDSGAGSWLARRPDGSWQEGSDGWLDAGIPEAAEYMTQAVVNLVRNYRVDGVQLDRIRYPDGGAWGYDAKTLARYRAETGAKGTPAPTDPAWQAWKREQITALVRRIALEVKLTRPSAWVSAATITYGAPPAPGDLQAFQKSRTYVDVSQDWPTWVREGLVELNVPMNYKREDLPAQRQWFDGWNAFAQSVRRRGDGQLSALAAGTALYLNSPAQSAEQARRSVAQGLGWVGYSYRTPTLSVYQGKQTAPLALSAVTQALSGVKTAGVLDPGLRWTEAAPSVRGVLGRVNGPVGGAVGSAGRLGGHLVEVWQGGKLVGRARTDGNGYYGFLTLAPGPAEVRVAGQRWAENVPERGVLRFPDLLLRRP
ncbi:Uncharacterized lipoprotein YddW, UPF0748 family [Deinococcus reticulitermitis]|uniref:Uncharacterized lipoprotein YddW, UPF0748 family n=1 Tax=Deinococcus reticulitermitis TaxID=856736 RepID=A0A1H6YH85_9DEIO|nr:family 10 glycosylhydrolase [Deinococcus reticulitermitis]SEJ40621.1 Uncharacterized lipoprotein YddW, UPF0748 family [Deinococcus reticulitermitis]